MFQKPATLPITSKAIEMAQRMKAHATKPDDLNDIQLKTHLADREFSSDLTQVP